MIQKLSLIEGCKRPDRNLVPLNKKSALVNQTDHMFRAFGCPPQGASIFFYSNFAGISPADDYFGAATQLVLL